MSLDLEHRGDHAVITFSGELTIPAVLELVGLIDGIVTNYFYLRVEMRISSPGGMVQAANPFFSALARWHVRPGHVDGAERSPWRWETRLGTSAS